MKMNRFQYAILTILMLGFLLPQTFKMPVEGATRQSYSQESFWYYPWGKSLTHKGVDIFAKKGTSVRAATAGIVLYRGTIAMGGNVVFILGPKWRLHYYAHLNQIMVKSLSFVSTSTQIGTVGTSGNAAGKAPHLHYTLETIIPYPWRVDKSVEGWRKMFYLNPIPLLNQSVKE